MTTLGDNSLSARPGLAMLAPALVSRIVDEALSILATVGVEVVSPGLRTMLMERGLRADPVSGSLLFDRTTVERAIGSTPRSFTLYNRDGQPHAELGGDNVHFVPGSSGLQVLDHTTGDTRPGSTADFVDFVRLADGLPHIAYLATAFSTSDIEVLISDAWRLCLCLAHSRKPIVSGAFTPHGTGRMAAMMQLFRHDKADLIARPLSIFTITAAGMFRYSEDSCQNLIDCVDWGIPVEIVPVTLMGLIAPVTIVGATVLHCVDVLAGLTMAQLLRPGHPVLFGGAPAAFHMKTGSSPMAAIEALQLYGAYVAVAKSLGLPTQAYMALSESKFNDAQAGAESFGGALLAALAGVNSVSGPGMLDYVMVYSLEKLVLDNELCGQALRFVRAIEPKNDLPMLDMVHELLAEKHLLTSEHTLKHWPAEMHLPDLVFDRLNRDAWRKAGSLSMQDRLRAEVRRGLAGYSKPPIDPQVVAEMCNMVKAGMENPQALPAIPEFAAAAESGPGRRPSRRKT